LMAPRGHAATHCGSSQWRQINGRRTSSRRARPARDAAIDIDEDSLHGATAFCSLEPHRVR
jgi:hypothetical protein